MTRQRDTFALRGVGAPFGLPQWNELAGTTIAASDSRSWRFRHVDAPYSGQLNRKLPPRNALRRGSEPGVNASGVAEVWPKKPVTLRNGSRCFASNQEFATQFLVGTAFVNTTYSDDHNWRGQTDNIGGIGLDLVA